MSDPDSGALEFPINQRLLEEAIEARERWRIMRDRLAKIDENKGKVSAVVYDRVRRDYEGKLKEAQKALLAKKDTVDRELAALEETRGKIGVQLEDHRQRLEEIKFRNTLGEYSDDEYQSAAREEQEKIAKFETVLNAVDNNISKYKSIFADETEIFASEEEPGEEDISDIAQIAAITASSGEAEPVTDSKGFIVEDDGEGGDYFSAGADAAAGSTEIEDSATSKAIPSPSRVAKAPPAKAPPAKAPPAKAPPAKVPPAKVPAKKRARVVIINGDDAGAAYPIEGTVSFGRAESNVVVLKDAKVSRQHAQIQQQGNEYVLIDLNSSNGSFVNGQRIEEHVLSDGDEIGIGDFILQFQL